jgi:hypothetical protein
VVHWFVLYFVTDHGCFVVMVLCEGCGSLLDCLIGIVRDRICRGSRYLSSGDRLKGLNRSSSHRKIIVWISLHPVPIYCSAPCNFCLRF